MGAGYNIPVSLSAASTTSLPQNTGMPVYFVFDSTDSRFGAFSQEANPVQPATATSSAANGKASSESSGSGVGVGGGGLLSGADTIVPGVPNMALVIAAAALIYFALK
jgi:hypothetical protein